MRQYLNDVDDVLRIVSHSSCFASANDDTDITPEEATVHMLQSPECIVLKPHDDTLFLFKRFNLITYEMHVMIIKGPARKKGIQSAVKAAGWLWDNTQAQKIITHIPEYHELSLMYAKTAGLKQEGLLKDAFMKDNKVYDLVVLGATKEDYMKLYKEDTPCQW